MMKPQDTANKEDAARTEKLKRNNRDLILAAMAQLHRKGVERVGPTDISLETAELTDDGRPMNISIVSVQLKRLAEDGVVERLPLGVRRGLYRFVAKS